MTSAASIRPKILGALKRTGAIGVFTHTNVTVDEFTGQSTRADTTQNVWMARYNRSKTLQTDQGFTTVEGAVIQVYALDTAGSLVSPAPKVGDRITYAEKTFTVEQVTPNEIQAEVISFECAIGEA